MRAKTKAALFVCGVLSAIALTVWPGCAFPPIPSSRKPILSRKKEDFAYPKKLPPSRSEIVGKLGEPDAYFPDMRVACYKVNDVTARHLLLLLFVIPVGVLSNPGALDVAFIEFDEHDNVLRAGMATGSRSDSLKVAAKKWLAEKAKEMSNLETPHRGSTQR